MSQPTTPKYIFAKGLVVALLLILGLRVNAENTAEFYNSLIDLSSPQLYDKGSAYHQNPSTLDSALVCYTILGNRANDSKTLEDRLLCIKAYAEMAYIYYFRYYDYSKAIENMVKAQELIDVWQENVPTVDLYYGLMFGSIGQQTQDEKTIRRSMAYLVKAFDSACESDDPHLVNMAFSNLVSHAYSLGETTLIADQHKKYMGYTGKNNDASYYTLFNQEMYKALDAAVEKRYSVAQQGFDKLLLEIPDEDKYSRYRCGIWEFKGLVYEDAGQYAAAEQALQEALRISQQYNLRDAQVEIYRDLTNLYGKMGRNEDRYNYQNHYLAIKDTLLNYQQVAAIDEIRFLSNMKKAELAHQAEQQAQAQRQRRILYILLVCGVLLVVACGFIWFIVSNMRKLRRRNEALYAKNEEVIRAQEEERKLRNRYESELAELRGKHSGLTATDTKDNDEASASDMQKYKGSSLTEAAKERLADKIRNVMENSEEIFSPDFSAERLADLTADKYKNVSQVINEIWGHNFSTLLNNYRIREACKRITDEKNYGNLTMEALSETVGFKSRSTFVVQFKRVTGLTPSQYQVAARKSAKTPENDV